jgi:hypothetical protein
MQIRAGASYKPFVMGDGFWLLAFGFWSSKLKAAIGEGEGEGA